MCYVTACGCNSKSLTRSENSECMYRATSRGTGRFKKLSSPVSGVHGGWKQESSSRVTGQRHLPESNGDRLTIVANEEFIEKNEQIFKCKRNRYTVIYIYYAGRPNKITN